MKTVKFYTLGCKVNQYETQSIREEFIQAGFKEPEDRQPCDIYLINTCTVTHRADADSFNLMRRVKRENPKARIIVTGCLTELDEDKIKKIDGVSLIVKNKDKNRIVEILESKYAQLITHNSQLITFFKGHTRAFLKIQDGCDNFCSYCKVPLVRGASRSRSLNEIILEADRLVKNGYKEIVLCGICLGDYGRDLPIQIDLFDVIEALENIDGLIRIRLSSIEAVDISDRLIQKMAESRKLCRHLHIPMQSGDDEILKKMNRNYTREDYLNLIRKIRSRIPDVAITTDTMVGFPGESEVNFNNTIGLIQEILPLKVHIFPYSRREGTNAFNNFKDELNPTIVKQRILQLKTITKNCSIAYRKQFLNKTLNVLIESRSKDKSGFWEGYTDNYIKVKVISNLNLKNQLIPLKLNNIVKDCILADLC